MSDNKPYSHSDAFKKYSEASPPEQIRMVLNAFQTIEELKLELEKAMDKVRKLQK